MNLLAGIIMSGFAIIESYLSNILVFFTLLILSLRTLFKKRSKYSHYPYPPTPKGGHLILGHIKLLGSSPHIKYTEFAQECGPIYQIFIGPKRTVVISDYLLIREAFRQPVFSGRPDSELTKLVAGYGVINAEGPRWREQRAFLHNALREFGARNCTSTSTPLVTNIKKQSAEFCMYLNQTNGEPVNIRVALARGVSNVIGKMLMSTTYEESPEFIRLLNLIEEGFTLLLNATYCNVYEFLKHIPHYNEPYTKIKNNHAETSGYFDRIVREHEEVFDENNIRDIVDAFLLQKMKNEAENRVCYFDEPQLVQLMADIFSAGLETVTSTLEWAFVFLMRNPDVQEKLYEEVERVIGTNRQPESSDLHNMPYLEATIHEVQRRGNVISMGNAHAALDDATLGGYYIPKGTHIIPNLWGVHMDPKLWDDPEAFKPERFIVGNKIVKPPYFMPFSVGRRMCIGDSLSRLELFHFLANIVQNFELRVPENGEPPSVDGISFLSLKPVPFNVCAIPRNQTVCS